MDASGMDPPSSLLLPFYCCIQSELVYCPYCVRPIRLWLPTPPTTAPAAPAAAADKFHPSYSNSQAFTKSLTPPVLTQHQPTLCPQQQRKRQAEHRPSQAARTGLARHPSRHCHEKAHQQQVPDDSTRRWLKSVQRRCQRHQSQPALAPTVN